MSHLRLRVKSGFRLSTLAISIGLSLMSSHGFALEALDDEGLADSTGEGIAFLPENFSMQFKDENNVAGAGSIRLIPVGPLSTAVEDKGYQKADIYLYGLSLAQSKKDYGIERTNSDWGTGFGNVSAIGATPSATDFGRPITSWGSATNPWIFKTITDSAPNFAGVSKDVPYLSFEAPLMHTTIPTTGPEASAYNLKMGFWADAFMRDKTIVENAGGDKYAGLSNRLRLNFVWDGFSVNGSNLKVFRTLDGVTAGMGGTYTANLKINNVITSKTFNYGLNTSYNETLGIAGVVRLNSGPTNGHDSRATVSGQTINRTTPVNDTTGITITYQPPTNADVPGSFPNGGMCTYPRPNTVDNSSSNAGQCLTQEGYKTLTHTASGTNNWTPPAAKSVIRINTQELLGSVFGDGTPALGGAGAKGNIPNFGPNSNAEGVFLYNPNINIVLGNLYQPLMFSTDGGNFSMELARIPDNAAIYKKIYQDYDNPNSTEYLGRTCNVHSCGSTVNLGGTSYQDSKATHSSITIGSTEYDSVKNRLTAYKGIEAIGISIGELKAGTALYSENKVDYTQVFRRTRVGNTSCILGICGDGSWGSWSAWSPVAPKLGTIANPNPYETEFNQNTNGQILGIQTTVPNPYVNNLNPPGATVANNFGSAVIDGLLIQHFKFTTTGLN